MTSDNGTQASLPLIDVVLPTGVNEQMPMPHINLSISRYEPESRGSRTQDIRIQENTPIPQLDGPVSNPMRDRRRLPENVKIMEEYFQGGTYLQEASAL